MVELGKRLKQFAKDKGGVSKLAVDLGISQPRLSQYISGKNEIAQEVLVKLSHLGCDMNWLFTGSKVVISREPGQKYSIGDIKQTTDNNSGKKMQVAGNIQGKNIHFESSGEYTFILEQYKVIFEQKDDTIRDLKDEVAKLKKQIEDMRNNQS